jgi:hypothetical protein
VAPVSAQRSAPPLSPEALTFGRVITATFSSAANGPVGGTWSPQYHVQFDPRNAVSQTTIVGRPDSGLELLGVETNQGHLDVGHGVYTITTFAPFAEPLVIRPTLSIRNGGFHTQSLSVGFPGLPPTVLTDTLVAQPPPLAFNVSRVYPGIARLAAEITQTFQVSPGSLGVVTDTLAAGEIRGGVYESVRTDSGACSFQISSFNCVLSLLGSRFPAAHITITALALELGNSDQLFRVSGGGQSLAITSTTVVESPPHFEVMIDIRPGAGENPINPTSHGRIPVAILSTENLAAPVDINRESLTFGRTGEEESLVFCHVADVNADPLVDLVCHFDTQTAGFQPGDTSGLLAGETFSGVPIRGMDSVRIVRVGSGP